MFSHCAKSHPVTTAGRNPNTASLTQNVKAAGESFNSTAKVRNGKKTKNSRSTANVETGF